MKKVIAIAAAMLMICAGASAQNSDKTQKQDRGQRPDEATMIQNKTKHMVEKYGLNETQAARLLALNQKYAGKMGGPGMGHGPGMGPGHDGPRPDGMGQMPDSLKGHRPNGPRPDGPRPDSLKAPRPPKDGAKVAEGTTADSKATTDKKAKKSKKAADSTDAQAAEDKDQARPEGPRGQRPELTEEQKAEMKARMEEMKAVREAYNAELKKIMTADQYKAYEEDMKRGPQGGHGGPHGDHGPEGGFGAQNGNSFQTGFGAQNN